MSTPKSVEQQLKEAIEASKQTLALSEQVTSLASEKEALSKRLAEIETALSAPKAQEPVAVDPLVINKLGELLAERELNAKAMSALTAQVARLEKEAAKKADLNEYVKQRMEDGEEGNTPAEKQHLDAGKKKGSKAEMPDFIKDKIDESEEDEACGPEWKKGKKGKKAAKASYDEEDEGDFGDLSDEEIQMIREYRQACDKMGKRADATLKNPTEEESKDFGKILKQPGLDPNKNNVNEDNTTSPSVKLGKKAAKAGKAKAETDVEEIMESTDQQKKEDAEGGEENEEHETTLSKPGKGAKKAEEHTLEPQAKRADDSIPPELMEYLKELVQQEKQKKETGKKGENSLGGINKQDVTGQPDQDGEESVLEKKDAKKGKKAEAPALNESVEKCIKEGCDTSDTKVHGEGCAPTKGNTTEVGDKNPLAEEAPLVPVAKQTLDSVVDVAVERLAQVAKAKEAVEAELAKKGETLAAEVKAKNEALTAVAQLQAKFEAMMAKLNQSEAADKSLEAKAAKLVAATAAEPVAAEISGDSPMTDADILAKFESISDAREKNRYFKANATAIARASQANLKRRS